jgi:serralysin
MAFDQEDAPGGLATRRFEPAQSGAVEHDDGAPRCACPACAGLVDSSELAPGDRPDSFLDAADRGDVGPNSKPSKTVAEAAYHLNRTYASWNDFWTQPGVSDVDNSWDDPYWGGAPSEVTFAFRSSAGSLPSGLDSFYRFSAQQIEMTLLALQAWADVANVVFIRVGTGTTGEEAYSNSATMLFSNYTDAEANEAAFAYYPSLSASGGDVWVHEDYDNPAIGNYAMLALIHEVGHAIGFSHPGDYNAGEGDGPITYADHAEYYEDSRQYTVMSYFGASNTGASHQGAYAATILLDDIAAAQRTYGVNTTTRTGDTVYGFNSTADRIWFSATSSTTKLIFAVWDAGGVDTLDFSGYSQNQIITLIQGHFSSVGGLTGNVAIAMGAVIENAIGGSGGDTLIGNSAGNRLVGNAGSDSLTGNGGADIFVATVGGGADTITDFSAASDLIDVSAFGGYVGAIQSGLNTLVTVAAGVTFTLLNFTATALTAANFITGAPPVDPPPAGYNLINGTGAGETLNGTAASDQIYGLAGDDTLNGGDSADWLEGGADNDLLNGGAEADTMIGGGGDDIYVVDNAGDVVTEEAAGGTDTVQTTLASYSLGANVETLTGTSGAGQTLTGNSLNNIVTGAGGADTLNGGDGNDRLNGGAGADAMTGGGGDDTYVVDNAGDTTVEVGGGGTDTVETGLATYTLAAEVENLTATSGAGQGLTGNGLANSITGGAGGDTITGAGGADALRGNGGADTFVATVGGGADTIADFVVGTDKIDVTAFGGYQSIVQDGLDTLVTVAAGVSFRLTGVSAGTVTAASFVGLAGANVITGNAASNVLNGTAGVDEISGMGGNDTLYGGAEDDVLDGGAGADTLYGEDGDDTLLGGDANDTLDGGTGADAMTGGLGNDTYVVDDAGDVVVEAAVTSKDLVRTDLASYVLPDNVELLEGTFAGGQTLTGTALANTITGAGGNDTLNGLAGIDVLYGGGGGDTLYGGADVDRLYGDAGDDTLYGDDGGDILYGGDGLDALHGGTGVDRLYGEAANDLLYGGDSNDVLDGGAGDDTLRGDQGSDTLTGGAGADLFVVTVGGGLDSIIDFNVAEDRIDLSAFGYYQTIIASGSDTLITFQTGVSMRLKGVAVGTVTDAIFVGLPVGGDYFDITGTAAAETLTGTGQADHILGLGGADLIRAGGGDDWLEGGDDADRLFGDAGADILEGGAGNDNIQGGDGDDVMTGGAGTDILVGGLGADTVVITVGGGADGMLDFQLGVDLIDVTAYGGYQSIQQKGADTLITFATGVTLKLKNILAANLTDASFIGLAGPAPVEASPVSHAPAMIGPEDAFPAVVARQDDILDGWLV